MFFKVTSPLPESDTETSCWCHYGSGSKYNEGNTQGKVRTYNRGCDKMYQSIIIQEGTEHCKSANMKFRLKNLNKKQKHGELQYS